METHNQISSTPEDQCVILLCLAIELNLVRQTLMQEILPGDKSCHGGLSYLHHRNTKQCLGFMWQVGF